VTQVRTIDLLVIVIYFVGVAVAGIYFARRNKSTESYFLGNRSFSGWVIGISMLGTSISSISFVGYPGDAYKTAWLRMVPNFTYPIGMLVAAYVFLPFFRRGKITSAFQYLEKRYGPSTRVYGACAFILFQLVRVSLILYLVSLLIHEFTHWPTAVCVIVAGCVVSFYTVAGGFEAVVWTDVVQTLILLVGGILALAVIVLKLPDGIGQIVAEGAAAGKFGFSEFDRETGQLVAPSWDFTFLRKTALMMLFIGLFDWLTENSSDQNTIQRYCASKTPADARRAIWICCWSSLPVWAYFMFLGTALWVFFKIMPDEGAARILHGIDGARAEQILPYFILNYMPVGLAGLVVAAVLAAAMSSLDSSINAISTVSIVDLYRRHLVKDRSDRHYLVAARCIGVAASVVMIGGALLLMANEEMTTLRDTMTVLTALAAGGLLGIYMLGFFTKIGDARAIGVGIVCTLVFTLYRALAEFGFLPDAFRVQWLDAIDAYYTGIVGNLLMFTIGLTLGALIPARHRDLTNLTVWTQDQTPLE
jgi:SSS family solute:Na+ symporter